MTWQRIVELARRQRPVARWGLALVMFALALDVRLLSTRYLAGLPSLTYLPAIIGATLLCGWQQASLVLALSVASGVYLFQPNTLMQGDARIRGVIALVMFVLVGAFEIAIISALVEAVRANQRLARQEKTLFLELQHRVANTLQFVAGMLTMGRNAITTPEQAAEVLEQSAARVTAMGQLHRRMYAAANDDRGFVPLLQDILGELFRGLDVTTKIEADLPKVPLSQMTPIVLLVTEAATNSAKHVFRNGRGSHFHVLLREEPRDRLRLTITDDGPGVPEPAGSSRGLGLRIMHGLAAQLGGKLIVEHTSGTTVSVEFPKA